MKYFIRNHCNIGHAIRALIPNYQELDPKVQWSYNSITNDYDTLTWESSVIPKPTKTEIESKLAELNLENESEAIKSYNKAIKIDPKFVLAYSNLCGLYGRSNQLKKLKETINKAENEGLSGNEEIKFRRGQLNSRNKDLSF